MSAQIVCFFATVLAKAWNWPMVPLEALDKEKGHIWKFGKLSSNKGENEIYKQEIEEMLQIAVNGDENGR